jgi:hypothetical protein
MRKRFLGAGCPAVRGRPSCVRSFLGFMTKVSSQKWYADTMEDDDGPATRRTRFRRF